MTIPAPPLYTITQTSDGVFQIFVNVQTIGSDVQTYVPYSTTTYGSWAAAQAVVNGLPGSTYVEVGGDNEEL